MFKPLGALVLLYALYGALTGEVYAKSGPGGRTITRADSPQYFWVVVAIYAGLGLALIFVF